MKKLNNHKNRTVISVQLDERKVGLWPLLLLVVLAMLSA